MWTAPRRRGALRHSATAGRAEGAALTESVGNGLVLEVGPLSGYHVSEGGLQCIELGLRPCRRIQPTSRTLASSLEPCMYAWWSVG
jgi:hypothetical protein